MRATEFLVARPRFAVVVALVVLIAGAIAVPLLPVAMYPTLARPAISVSCSYPGASAAEVMNTVAGPLEEKVNGVEGMDRMTSSCYDSGAYSLTVNFQVGYDRDVALMKVQSKVQQALSLLPQEVKNTGVTVESGTTEELGILTLRSPGGKLTRDQVADYVFGVVNPAVLRIPGVGKSTVMDDKIAVRVWMKPDRLAALGLNTEDVVAAIKAQNVQASLGSVGARPSGGESARVVSLISKGRLSTPAEFGEIIVATDANGGLVRLKDVARIATGPQGYSYSALYEETPAVYISIYLLPGANPLEAMAAVKRELRSLEPYFPADLTWDMTYDTTDYMVKALRGVGFAIALSVLAAFALALFALRSLKGALLAVASALLPVSFSAAAFLALGMQVNLLVLYAILVAFAFAVGSAAWAIAKVRSGGLPGMEQLAAGAVVAFAALPLAFGGGVQGVLFRQLSVTLVVMAAASALSSLLLVPVAAKWMWRGVLGEAQSARCHGASAVRTGGFVLALLLAALAGLVSYVLAGRLPREFVPDEDMGVLYVDCKTAEGTPMEVTTEVMRRVYREARALGGVEKCATLLGTSIINGAGENQAKMLLVLKDWSERGDGESSYDIARRIQKIAADIPEAELFAIRIPPVKGMGSQGGVCVLFQAIGDNDPAKFSREVLRMRDELAKSPLVETVTGGFYTDTPHLRVVVDRAKCELMKVPMSSIYTALQHNLGSIYINDVNLGTQVNRVTAMSDWSGRAKPDDIRGLYVRSKTGAMVPIDTLVTCREELGPRACYRCNQYLYCTEQFVPKPGVSTSEAIEEVRRICREKLSSGFRNDWAGFTYESLKTGGGDSLLVVLSVLLAYLVLVAYHESCRAAFRALLPSVAAAFGALVALFATGTALSVYSRYAIVALVSLTAAMSLLPGRGADARTKAILPLLAALAILPLAFASGPGSAGSRSFGVAIVGGYAAYAVLGCLIAALLRNDEA